MKAATSPIGTDHRILPTKQLNTSNYILTKNTLIQMLDLLETLLLQAQDTKTDMHWNLLEKYYKKYVNVLSKYKDTVVSKYQILGDCAYYLGVSSLGKEKIMASKNYFLKAAKIYNDLALSSDQSVLLLGKAIDCYKNVLYFLSDKNDYRLIKNLSLTYSNLAYVSQKSEDSREAARYALEAAKLAPNSNAEQDWLIASIHITRLIDKVKLENYNNLPNLDMSIYCLAKLAERFGKTDYWKEIAFFFKIAHQKTGDKAYYDGCCQACKKISDAQQGYPENYFAFFNKNCPCVQCQSNMDQKQSQSPSTLYF